MLSPFAMLVSICQNALPAGIPWEERLQLAAQAGYDFVEISIDESDSRLARLEWPALERAALRQAIANTGVPIKTMCLRGHRKYALGSAAPEIRSRALDILHRAIDVARITFQAMVAGQPILLTEEQIAMTSHLYKHDYGQ